MKLGQALKMSLRSIGAKKGRTIARCLLPDIQAYFEGDEGKWEFAAWQEKQQSEKRGKG